MARRPSRRIAGGPTPIPRDTVAATPTRRIAVGPTVNFLLGYERENRAFCSEILEPVTKYFSFSTATAFSSFQIYTILRRIRKCLILYFFFMVLNSQLGVHKIRLIYKICGSTDHQILIKKYY